MFLNCGVEEDSWESLGLQGVQPVHPKWDHSWIFFGGADDEAETPILWPPDAKNWLIWKRPWCWERLKAGGEGDDRGYNGWMTSPIRWTWVWASSGSWWWTGKRCVLQSMGSQRIGYNWATELNWRQTQCLKKSFCILHCFWKLLYSLIILTPTLNQCCTEICNKHIHICLVFC